MLPWYLITSLPINSLPCYLIPPFLVNSVPIHYSVQFPSAFRHMADKIPCNYCPLSVQQHTYTSGILHAPVKEPAPGPDPPYGPGSG